MTEILLINALIQLFFERKERIIIVKSSDFFQKKDLKDFIKEVEKIVLATKGDIIDGYKINDKDIIEIRLNNDFCNYLSQYNNSWEALRSLLKTKPSNEEKIEPSI